MHILVLNCGSSSLRFQLVETDLEAIKRGADRALARGTIERIGSEALVSISADGGHTLRDAEALRDHRAALDYLLRILIHGGDGMPPLTTLASIQAVGHRVVHGGEKLTRSALIDAAVLEAIRDCIDLAPLHNPANIRGIEAARELLGPAVPQVAVFDTAFHAGMPPESYLYALPYQLYARHRLRRYGFHGTSHRYVAWRYRQLTGRTREQTRIITFHLGNGCSACAIRGGESLDTSMGLTPLEGLVMGTRSGDVDASVLDFLHHKEGLGFNELDALLNKQSGLLGLSGLTNDMRELLVEAEEHGDRRARLAIDIFCLRARKYLGAYLARLNGADAVVFTGGIGENAAAVRAAICADSDFLGIVLDPAANTATVNGREGAISIAGARVAVYVIPTNEERLIARDTVRCLRGDEVTG